MTEQLLKVPSWVIVSAVRYALRRLSYIVDDTVNLTRSVWEGLPDGTRDTIARDVSRYVDNVEYVSSTGYGLEVRPWIDLQDFIDEHGVNRGAVSETHVPAWDWVLISAVRYALGRQTYIVSMTCSYVRDVWESLGDNTRYVISKDVHEFVVNNPDFSPIDLKEWKDLLEFITFGDDCET